jgi:GLPGLI family protein
MGLGGKIDRFGNSHIRKTNALSLKNPKVPRFEYFKALQAFVFWGIKTKHMRNSTFFFCFLALFFFSHSTYLSAQEIRGGSISYEQIIDYQLEGAYDSPIWDSYIAELPKQGKVAHILTFTRVEALFEEDLSKKELRSEHLRTAMEKANYLRTPKPEVKQVYMDLETQKRIHQLEFMTRSFLVEYKLEALPWKLTNKQKKILDYVCMGAELVLGEETLTAWFTPQIPISVGPGAYYGLPGLILGLEKNEEVFLLATSVDLKVPQEDLSSRLNKGKKMSEKAFEKVVEEKTEEFKKDREAKKNAGKGSKK